VGKMGDGLGGGFIVLGAVLFLISFLGSSGRFGDLKVIGVGLQISGGLGIILCVIGILIIVYNHIPVKRFFGGEGGER
jgi:hypothetical protein